MKPILIKLLRDFRLSKVKFFLFIVAAALSAWGISSFLYSYSMATRDFKENFTGTRPADIVFKIKNMKQGLLAVLSKEKGVEGVERREALTGRIKGWNDGWMPILLFAVEDFDHVRMDQFKILENNS